MRIEVDGIQYQDFVSASATLRLDALARTFSFVATSDQAVPLPFKGGEACKVVVNGEDVITGFIELVNVDGDDESHTIQITGRGKTADLLDSSIGTLDTVIRPGSLKSVVEQIIGHIGADLQVIDDVSPAPFNSAEDIVAPEPGQNCFDFLERLARKRQVLLTSDGEGNVVIAQGSGTTVEGAFVQHRVADDSNNVLAYSASYDLTGRFNVYRMVTQLNQGALNLAGVTPAASVVSQGQAVVVRDNAPELQARARQLVLVGENMSSGPEDQKRAVWEQNIRRARGRVYSATIDGHRNQAGLLWTPNTLIRVVDEYAGINALMLVNTVEFQLNDQGGRTTILSFVESDAYSLALQEPVTEKVGDGLVLS